MFSIIYFAKNSLMAFFILSNHCYCVCNSWSSSDESLLLSISKLLNTTTMVGSTIFSFNSLMFCSLEWLELLLKIFKWCFSTSGLMILVKNRVSKSICIDYYSTRMFLGIIKGIISTLMPFLLRSIWFLPLFKSWEIWLGLLGLWMSRMKSIHCWVFDFWGSASPVESIIYTLS